MIRRAMWDDRWVKRFSPTRRLSKQLRFAVTDDHGRHPMWVGTVFLEAVDGSGVYDVEVRWMSAADRMGERRGYVMTRARSPRTALKAALTVSGAIAPGSRVQV